MTETNAADIIQRKYVYGNYLDEVLMKIEDTSATDDLYYTHDHLYSLAAFIESDGDVVERYEYDAYGMCQFQDPNYDALATQQSGFGNKRLFTGKEWDILDSCGLYLQNSIQRIYNMHLGRFLQPDPLGINDGVYIVEFTKTGVPIHPRNFTPWQQYQDGMSLYEYVKSKPVLFVDPYGLEPTIDDPSIFNTPEWRQRHWPKPRKIHVPINEITYIPAVHDPPPGGKPYTPSDEVVIKRKDPSFENGFGHEWIEGCGTSWGWGPDPSGGRVGIWGWLKADHNGLLSSSDSHEDEIPDKMWKTSIKTWGIMRHGPKMGKFCCHVTHSDVCACLRSFTALNTNGKYGGYIGQHGYYNADRSIRFYGDCRDFTGFAINSCCLEKQTE